MARNIALYPWFKLAQALTFWQATWFLYFQQSLSAAEAILLYAVYDIVTTVLEVPSGYASDRLGRRVTLIASAMFGVAAALMLALGGSFLIFALGQACLGAMAAFYSGTDTSLLYESLAAEGREDEVEVQELRAWRFEFSALALSAVTGGAMALWSPALPFLANAAALAVALFIALQFREPPHEGEAPGLAQEGRALRRALTNRTLAWLFALSVVMYGFSHIPFVFGQPFIEAAMQAREIDAGAPLVSGVVTTIMMGISVAVSLIARPLRQRIGLPAILLLAFGIQIGLAAALALSSSALIIGLLFLRMVPNSLSQPFIRARIQPELEDRSRATYLSLQSLTGRVVFAATLVLASGAASDRGQLSFEQIHIITGGYALAGLLVFAALAATVRLAKVGAQPSLSRLDAP